MNEVSTKGMKVDLGAIEWSFDCDEASKKANDLFSEVMDRDWLIQHNIHPFDMDAAWTELKKQLSYLREPCVLNVTRAMKPNASWDSFVVNLVIGSE